MFIIRCAESTALAENHAVGGSAFGAEVLWPLNKVGGEFLPQINEGACCICHRRCRGFPQQRRRACAKNRQADYERTGSGAGIWQNGKAETATDSAPLEMVETTIRLSRRISGGLA